MNISKELNALIAQRKILEEDIDYQSNPIIQAMVKLLITDPVQTNNFLEHDCTEEQFIWISEILDEIVAKTNSITFLDEYQKLLVQYPEAAREFNIQFFIDSAKEFMQ